MHRDQAAVFGIGRGKMGQVSPERRGFGGFYA
jgi:hypothetical protein